MAIYYKHCMFHLISIFHLPFDTFLLIFFLTQLPNESLFSSTLYCCMLSCVYMLSHFNRVQLFVTLWTVADEASLFMELYRQEYWSRVAIP